MYCTGRKGSKLKLSKILRERLSQVFTLLVIAGLLACSAFLSWCAWGITQQVSFAVGVVWFFAIASGAVMLYAFETLRTHEPVDVDALAVTIVLIGGANALLTMALISPARAWSDWVFLSNLSTCVASGVYLIRSALRTESHVG